MQTASPDSAPEPAGESCRHMVQFYGAGEEGLIESVCNYFRVGLATGQGILAIATGGHCRSFVQRLQRTGMDTDALQKEGIAVFADAGECLSAILRNGEPDAARFGAVVGGLAERLPGNRHSLRAYGEMVGLLWSAGRKDAAMVLEQYWNEFLRPNQYHLLCGYPIDVFGCEFPDTGEVLCAHGRLLPSAPDGHLGNALERALAETLGNKVESLRAWMQGSLRPGWAAMPKAEADILWLRLNLPGMAPGILERARRYCRTSQAPVS